MIAYFDRTAALFLVREQTFDAYPVEVPAGIVEFTEMINALAAMILAKAEYEGAPEDSAQLLADLFVEGLRKIARELDE